MDGTGTVRVRWRVNKVRSGSTQGDIDPIQARSQDFFWGGGGVRSLERKGYFCQRFSVAVKSIITNSGMIIVFYYRPTQSRLDLNGPL